MRTLTRGKGSERARYAIGAASCLVAFAVVFLLSLGGLRALLAVEEGLANGAVAAVYTVTALASVVVGLATAVYTMYLSKDLDLLSSMPIKERTILAYKFWETLVGNSALFAILGLPVVLAYGVAAGASVFFYPAVIVVSVLVLMVPTGLCAVLVVPIMRLVPASKAQEIVAALGLLGAALVYAAQSWLLAPDRTMDPNSVSPLETLVRSPLLNAPPGGWASDALVGAATLDWEPLLGGLLPLAALALGVYVVCLALTGWAYTTGRARAAESGGRARSSGWAGRLLRPLPRDVRAVAAKDLASLPRDLRRLATMLFPIAMVVPVIALNLDFLATLGRSDDALLVIPHLLVAGVAGLVCLSAGAQTVGIEGRSYWFLAASPLGPWRILAGKAAAVFSLGAIVAVVGSPCVSVFLGFYPPGPLLGLASGLSVSAVVTLCAVGTSALLPRFDWENPNQATSPAGAVLLLSCVMVLVILAGALIFAALNAGDPAPVWARLAIAGALWTLIGAIPAYALFSAGAAKLKKMEWDP